MNYQMMTLGLTSFYDELLKINNELKTFKSSLKIYHGDPLDIFKQLSKENPGIVVYTNRDYEPYAIYRDEEIDNLLSENGSWTYFL